MTRAAFLALLLAVTPAAAQPAPRPVPAKPAAPATPDQRRAAAAQLLTTLGGVEPMAAQVSAAHRERTITAIVRSGATPFQAGEVFDQYVAPDLKARVPELAVAIQDVLLTDFTLPEMQALNARQDGEAFRSAQAKLPQLNAHLSEAAIAWVVKASNEAFEKNRTELAKLGLNLAGGS